MTDKTNHVEKLKWIMEQLADSVLELSDEAVLAETTEAGGDPQEEAEHIRIRLRQVSESFPKSAERNRGTPRRGLG